MDSIFMGIGNIIIVKTSTSSSSSTRTVGKEAYIDIWERRVKIVRDSVSERIDSKRLSG